MLRFVARLAAILFFGMGLGALVTAGMTVQNGAIFGAIIFALAGALWLGSYLTWIPEVHSG